MVAEETWLTTQPRPKGFPPRAPSRQKKGTASQLVLPTLTSARVSGNVPDISLVVEPRARPFRARSRSLLPAKTAPVRTASPIEPHQQASDLVPKLLRAFSQVPEFTGEHPSRTTHARSVSWSADERRALAPSTAPCQQTSARTADAEAAVSRQGSRASRASGGGGGVSEAATEGGATASRPRRRRPVDDEGAAQRRPESGRSPASPKGASSPSSQRHVVAQAAAEPELTGVSLCGWAASLASPPRTREAQGNVRLLASAFEGRPPVLFFDYEPRCGAAPRNANRVLGEEELEALGFSGGVPKMYFSHEKTKDVHEYNATLNTLQHNGVARTTTNTGRWALLWTCHPSPEALRGFHPLQRTNHFPGSWHLGRKDWLNKNIARMRRQWPKEYNIAPAGFVLPEDFQAWVTAREQSPSALWIWKPCNAACGRGIRLYSSSVSASADRKLSQKAGVVQRYVDNPLLVNGYKFDLRLYVVVTSYDPLRVYLNAEGLVRLATERYSASADSLDHRTMHLTNYSVNKHSEGYAKNLDGRTPSRPAHRGTGDAPMTGGAEQAEEAEAADAGEDEGGCPSDEDAEGPSRQEQRSGVQEEGGSGGRQASKWSLGQLREYCATTGLDYELMMRRIKDLLIKSLIAAEQPITGSWHQGANYSSLGVASAQLGPHQTCFEIYGFDVMVDDKLKPWLLEVNVFPSLSSSSPFDKRVKTMLISDTLTLVGLLPFDPDLVDKAQKEEQMKRFQGQGTKPGSISRSHTVQSISTAALRDLGEAEWRLILDTHDEYMRRGLFDRIFPRRETLGQYDRFFAAPRYSNLVLARWLEAGGERCFLPEAREQVPPQIPRQVHFDAC